MPRRKRSVEGTITADHHESPEGPVTTAEAPNDVEQAFHDAGISTDSQADAPAAGVAHENHEGNGHVSASENASDGQRADKAEQAPRRLVRGTFSSSLAGVHAVEDKRFNLPRVGIDFDDDKRANDEEKRDLKEAGLRYDPRDKGYTAIANSETRQARDELAQKFTDRRLKEKAEQDEGQSR